MLWVAYLISVQSRSFHIGLSNEINTDGDSDVFDSDGDMLVSLPKCNAHPDAVVEAY